MARNATANWPAMPRTTSASAERRRADEQHLAEARAEHEGGGQERPDGPADAEGHVQVPGRRVAAVEHVCRDDDDQDPDAAEREPREQVDEHHARRARRRRSTRESDGRGRRDCRRRHTSGATPSAPVGSAGGVAAAPEAGLGAAPGLWLGRVHRIAAISVNDTALSTNASTRSPVARSRPAMAGPTIQARLSRVAQAEFAGPNSRSSRTRLGTRAPMAG